MMRPEIFAALMILLTAIVSGCSGGKDNKAIEYAARCEATLSPRYDPLVFSDADSNGTAPSLLAMAYERATYVGADRVKSRPRPDIRKIVTFDDESDGYSCYILDETGYVVANMSTYLNDDPPPIRFARRLADNRVEIVSDDGSPRPKLRRFLKADVANAIVGLYYETSEGEEQASGYSFHFIVNSGFQICNRDSGSLVTFAKDGQELSQQTYGCEAQRYEQIYAPHAPNVISYDQYGNPIAESGHLNLDDVLEKAAYEITTNERGDWQSREVWVTTGTESKAKKFRTEYRFIEYRD